MYGVAVLNVVTLGVVALAPSMAPAFVPTLSPVADGAAPLT